MEVIKMKETIIKSVAAILCAVIVCVAVLSAVGTYSDAQVKAAEISASGHGTQNNIGANDTDYVAPESNAPDEEPADISTPENPETETDLRDETTQDNTADVEPSSDPSEWTKHQI